ncbi:MAG: hypothetical protein NZ805_07610 [Armatimonadetes bacterium]|nr:hypothetical protein [Armatimonadota bacterium]MDW8029271.1 hypothetical protein [Armatimonadota bacterium]
MNDLLSEGLREVWEASRVSIERRDENWLDNDLEVQRRAIWLRTEKQIFRRLQDRFWKALFETAKKRFEADLPKWLRLTPPDPRCEELLVAAIAWRLAKAEEVADKGVLAIGSDRLSSEFPAAVRQIEEDTDARRRIDYRVIQPHLQKHSSDETALGQLLDQLLNLEERDLNMLGVEGLTKGQAKVIALRFIQQVER